MQVAQDYTPELLQYLRQEPEEQEWATARPKRNKGSGNDAARHAQTPLALFDRYCTEGKMMRSHIDDRQGALLFNTLLMLYCSSTVPCFADSCLQSSQAVTSAPGLS